jgi:hypothetical protein
MSEKKFTKHDIAQLAAHLSGMYLEALEELRQEHGASWYDFVYSNFLALRGVGQMLNPDEAEVVHELRLIFDEAMTAQVVGKRFKSEEEMQAWMARRGLEPDDVTELKPKGATH